MCGGHSNPKRAYNRGTRTTGRIVFQGTSFSVDARGGGRYIWTGSPRLFGIGPLPIAGMMWGMRGPRGLFGSLGLGSEPAVGWVVSGGGPAGERSASGVLSWSYVMCGIPFIDVALTTKGECIWVVPTCKEARHGVAGLVASSPKPGAPEYVCGFPPSRLASSSELRTMRD